VDHFSARWEGALVAPEDGEYEIGLEGDDGFRLYLQGEKIIDDWNNGPKRYKSAKVTLKKGQKVPLKIDYYQGAAERSLRLAWRTPSQIKALAAAYTGIDLKMATYLPQGAAWYDFYTNARFEGGQTITRDAPLDIIPLYVKAGSIIPMGPLQQYATEKPDAPYEIRVYPGADATFTIYEDDNETYKYEKGQYATYDLTWNDKAQTLAIGARKGSYPGLVPSRTLNIVLAKPGQGTGGDPAPATKTIVYDGKAQIVSLKE
jgi:alpha-D-xyloside xylohydrolase